MTIDHKKIARTANRRMALPDIQRAAHRCEHGLPAISALRARPSDSPDGPLSARRRATLGVTSLLLLTVHLPDDFLPGYRLVERLK